MKIFCSILCTWFGVGFFPKFPGTVGSLAAFFLIPIVLHSSFASLSLIFILFFISIWAVSSYLLHSSVHDPPEVVVDEVLGQIIAFFVSHYLINRYFFVSQINGVSNVYYVSLFFVTFIFFRFFDILKIWPICVIDKEVKGALGVMLDDIVAGLFAAFCVTFLYSIFHLINLI